MYFIQVIMLNDFKISSNSRIKIDKFKVPNEFIVFNL